MTTTVHQNHFLASRRSQVAVTLTAALLFSVLGSASAQASLAPSAFVAPAAAPAATANSGWIRLAHLSPDTKAVDIQLTALAGGAIVKSLKDVTYGQVSEYMALPQGTYVVAMVPAGGDMSHPMIQTSISVKQGQPMTVAALGKNANLKTVIFADDLTTPTDGQTRIRVIQASTTVPSVNISTTRGTIIASDAKKGTATGYASVPAGAWSLDLTSNKMTSTAQVNLKAGSVSSLFVLDNASGGVTIKSIIDASSVGGTLPPGGIQTGGGATAHHVSATLADFYTFPR
jgi:hypothetical protein